MKLDGIPLELAAYKAETITNTRFKDFDLAQMDCFYLPESLTTLVEDPQLFKRQFIEDDNRGAILPEKVATLDGREFFLSVKGIGSTVDPYSWRTLDRLYASELSDDEGLRQKLLSTNATGHERIITGELWLRGSPYGGQGIEHATTAMRISEMADLTSIGGFLIAPLVKIAFLPKSLEEQLRHLHWYRKYKGRFVQEIRLVPSNIRVYFHAKNTLGGNVGHIFDLFSIDSDAKAMRFEINFLRSTVAMLTLFPRTLTIDKSTGACSGLDFNDVWLDKDAVLAPDGAAYFVDLEGIEETRVEKSAVKEKIEDQIYRSLYELTFAYEQIEQERWTRFGGSTARKARFRSLLEEALRDDPFVRLRTSGQGIDMIIRNKCMDESLYTEFGILNE